MRRVLLALVVAGMIVPVLARGASAHPSDLDTLTVDLILDRGGLVLIDAAANGTTYPAAPAERSTIALRVLDALGIPRDTVEIDAAESVLYHEVGFTVRLHQPFANTLVPGEYHLDARALKAVAHDTVGGLRVDVCRVAWPEQTLALEASLPVSAPDPAGAGAASFDRRDCASWTLGPDDEPLYVTAHTIASAPEAAARTTAHLLCGTPADLDATFVPRGAIALPAAPLPARATGASDPAAQLVTETVLFVKAATALEFVIPRSWRGRMGVSSHQGVRATERARMPACKGIPGYHGWLVSRISFWIDQPACAAVIVKTRTATRRVPLGIGAPCPANTH